MTITRTTHGTTYTGKDIFKVRLLVLKHRMKLAIALGCRERVNTFTQVKREFGYKGHSRQAVLDQFLADHFPGEKG